MDTFVYPAMYSPTYNIVAIIGIILAIAFAMWVSKKTKEVQHQNELLKTQRLRTQRANHR